MKRLASALIIFVAIEHLGFLVLEMFLWTSPTGMRVFGLTPEFARQSAMLAANQGLYNGFLAAGLIWSVLQKGNTTPGKMFFLGCVIVAGAFGGLTVKTSIFFVQGMPALAAMVLVILSQRKLP
jgi:putative membrane protein